MKQLVGILTVLALAQPALAQTVLDTDFTISVPQLPGQPDVVESSTLVPLVAGTCFNWHIRLSKTKGSVEVRETYTLPEAPDTWGLGEHTNITVSKDRKSAVSELELTPEDGWIGNGWCVTEGDPAGYYWIEVESDGLLMNRFDFELREM